MLDSWPSRLEEPSPAPIESFLPESWCFGNFQLKETPKTSLPDSRRPAELNLREQQKVLDSGTLVSNHISVMCPQS